MNEESLNLDFTSFEKYYTSIDTAIRNNLIVDNREQYSRISNNILELLFNKWRKR